MCARVCEFLDVFLEELSIIPPERDIEFIIELLPGSTLISKPPYKMAPKSLEKMKKQFVGTVG